MTLISKDINKAAAFLEQGEIVAIPTETVYGLAGNIYNELAIRKIFEVKKRPLFNPLIVHLHDLNQLDEMVEEFPDNAKLLAQSFWPGSLTMILKKKDHIPNLITANKSTVALRMPNHPITLSLLKKLSFPIAAPSANPFNRISPTNPEHVRNYFDGIIPMILDGGSCKKGIESTIVGFQDNDVIIYRLGAISMEEIESVVGQVQLKNKSSTAPDAPGMLDKHYAPKTITYLVDDVTTFTQNHEGKAIGVILFTGNCPNAIFNIKIVLSQSGDLKEAASKLYGALHELDKHNLDMIVAQRFPNYGLGKSINDRLERASGR